MLQPQASGTSTNKYHPHDDGSLTSCTTLSGLCGGQQGSRSRDRAWSAPRRVGNHVSKYARACPTLIPEKRRLAWKPCGGGERETDRV